MEEEIFDYWLSTMRKDRSRTKFTGPRRTRIRARLREGYTPEDLCAAIRGATRDVHLMGQNERARPYNDLPTILRDGPQVERLRDLDPGEKRPKVQRTREQWVDHFVGLLGNREQAEEEADAAMERAVA